MKSRQRMLVVIGFVGCFIPGYVAAIWTYSADSHGNWFVRNGPPVGNDAGASPGTWIPVKNEKRARKLASKLNDIEDAADERNPDGSDDDKPK